MLRMEAGYPVIVAASHLCQKNIIVYSHNGGTTKVEGAKNPRPPDILIAHRPYHFYGVQKTVNTSRVCYFFHFYTTEPTVDDVDYNCLKFNP